MRPEQAAEVPAPLSFRAERGFSHWPVFKALRDSSSPEALLKVTSFPRKRESLGPTMAPRLCGDDDDFHCQGWAKGPRKLLGMTGQTKALPFLV